MSPATPGPQPLRSEYRVTSPSSSATLTSKVTYPGHHFLKWRHVQIVPREGQEAGSHQGSGAHGLRGEHTLRHPGRRCRGCLTGASARKAPDPTRRTLSLVCIVVSVAFLETSVNIKTVQRHVCASRTEEGVGYGGGFCIYACVRRVTHNSMGLSRVPLDTAGLTLPTTEASGFVPGAVVEGGLDTAPALTPREAACRSWGADCERHGALDMPQHPLLPGLRGHLLSPAPNPTPMLPADFTGEWGLALPHRPPMPGPAARS